MRPCHDDSLDCSHSEVVRDSRSLLEDDGWRTGSLTVEAEVRGMDGNLLRMVVGWKSSLGPDMFDEDSRQDCSCRAQHWVEAGTCLDGGEVLHEDIQQT